MDMKIVSNVYIAVMRYAMPAVSALLLLRCFLPLLTFRRDPEIWGWLETAQGLRFPLEHWETVIGRSKRCDIVLDLPTVSRTHAVLTRYDDGSWTILDTDSKTGVQVNDHPVSIWALSDADMLLIGGVPLRFQSATAQQQASQAVKRRKAASGSVSAANLLLLTALQACTCVAFLLDGAPVGTAFAWAGLVALQWLLLIFYLSIHRPAFEVETIAFFLCSVGMAVIASVSPGEMRKQLLAIALGITTFLLLGWTLRSLERAKRIRYVAAVAGMGLLVITLLFGTEFYGAKNWIILGGISLQPSELAKVCFVYVGAATMDSLLRRRNLILFIAYTVALCGLLALMNDFGTAMVFFSAFLIIAYLRSGSMGTVALACTALLFAGVIGLQIAPHALRRFAAWRNIWQDPWGAGYQQTQALMCIASGGLFGLGIGRGKMTRIFAADSDVVFATVSEEWGLAVAVLCVSCIVALGLFSLRCVKGSRSSFYAIGSCTAASILLVQTIFNVLGTVDILPLTGVTFPLLSNGGSSMISVWGLLAFIKAADTRQNGSFAVKLQHGGKESE